MAFETRTPADARGERSKGNIYDRLEAARQQREKVLDTPTPANDSRTPTRPTSRPQSFPTLKPQAPDILSETRESSFGWGVPLLLALVILGLIFSFAVG